MIRGAREGDSGTVGGRDFRQLVQPERPGEITFAAGDDEHNNRTEDDNNWITHEPRDCSLVLGWTHAAYFCSRGPGHLFHNAAFRERSAGARAVVLLPDQSPDRSKREQA